MAASYQFNGRIFLYGYLSIMLLYLYYLIQLFNCDIKAMCIMLFMCIVNILFKDIRDHQLLIIEVCPYLSTGRTLRTGKYIWFFKLKS
jgi:hypothetical protein